MRFSFCSLLTIILSIHLPSIAKAQPCFMPLEDFTGYSPKAEDLANLETGACAILEAMPNPFQGQFKVYDFGFYLHNESMEGTRVNEILNEQEQVIAGNTPYYLLFGRQSDPSGLFKKFWVRLKLPETGIFECASPEMLDNLAGEITSFTQMAYNSGGASPSAYPDAELVGMDRLKRYVEKQVDCCLPGFRTSNTCGSCLNMEDLSSILTFNEYQATAINAVESYQPTYEDGEFFVKNADVTIRDENDELVDMDEVLSELAVGLNEHFTPVKVSLTYYDANSCPQLLDFSEDKRGERFMYIDVVVVDNGAGGKTIYSKTYAGVSEEEATEPRLYILRVGLLGFYNQPFIDKLNHFLSIGGCTANIVMGPKLAYPNYKRGDRIVIIGKDREAIYNVAKGKAEDDEHTYCDYFSDRFCWEIHGWIKKPKTWEITDGQRRRAAVVDVSSIDLTKLGTNSLSEGAAFIAYHALGHMAIRGHSDIFTPDGFMSTGSGIMHILGTKELSGNRYPAMWDLYDNLDDLIADPDLKFRSATRTYPQRICTLFD